MLIAIILVILAIIVFDEDEVIEDDLTETEQIENDYDEGLDETIDWEDDALAYTGAGVSGYVDYIGVKAKMGVDHEYTNKALFYLIDAVREVAENKDIDISEEMEAVREEAKYITQNWKATDHAGSIKNAGTKIVDVLHTMQMESFPDLAEEVAEVKMAVQEINPDVLTLNQKENVLSFFDEAANVLRKMNQ